MEVLKKVSKFAGKYMAIIVLAIAVLAFFVPQSFLWVGKDYNAFTRIVTVNNLLMVVMFGMGLTLKLDDFKVVFSRPKDVLVGCTAQFVIMPLLAFLLTKVFPLSPELAVGVILVGTCPGGTSSNVMTFLAKGCLLYTSRSASPFCRRGNRSPCRCFSARRRSPFPHGL